MSNSKEDVLEKLNRITARSLIDFDFAQQLLDPKTREKAIAEFDFNEKQAKAIIAAEGQCLQEFTRSILESLEINSPRKSKERK